MPSHGPIMIMAQLSILGRVSKSFIQGYHAAKLAWRPRARNSVTAEKSCMFKSPVTNPHAIFGYVSDDLVPEALQGCRPFGDILLRRHVIQVQTHERYRVLAAERKQKKRIRQEATIHLVIACFSTGSLSFSTWTLSWASFCMCRHGAPDREADACP